MSVSLLMPDIYATTTNQQNSVNTTNLTKSDNITMNNSCTDIIQSTTVPNLQANGSVNVTVTNQYVIPNNTASSVNNSDNLNVNNESSDTIQYAKEAAGDNVSSNVQGNWFVTKNLTEASGWVKSYIEVNNVLPKYVQIGNIQVSMPQFLELITKDLVQLNNGINTPIELGSFNTPTNSNGNITNGNINKSEYLTLASKIQNFMDSMGRAPNYATSTLGNIQYESLIYMYSRILDFYGVNNRLPNNVTIKTLANNTTKSNSSSNSTVNDFTISEITTAAGSVANYIDQNQKLPNYVTISNTQISMPQFLELLNNGLLQINGNKNTLIALNNVTKPPSPSEDLESGDINKSEYIDLASEIQNFMDSTGRAPNYATSTLGNIQYETLIYLESQIMNFFSVNNRLPNYAVVNPWNESSNETSTIPPSLDEYLQPTTNCQSNNPTIIALANKITAGLITPYAKAVALFNWVTDNISYSFYYNTLYGAVGTLKAGTGNCCDHSNLMVALARAAGIPARYQQGYCDFSDGWYGHVWAQLYVNGQWYYADTISTLNTFGVINNWNLNTYTLEGTYASLPF
jgi:uncharacterized protein YpmS